MNIYDEKIKAVDNKIKKLNEDIKKKKSQLSKLQSERKQLEADKDREYSESFLKKIAELGITSDEKRSALLDRIEEFVLKQELSESEINLSEEKTEITNSEETVAAPITENPTEADRPTEREKYQTAAFPHTSTSY